MRNTFQQYFYHPDHLGSSSFISDASGGGCQFLAYLPFGEQWVDQQSSGSYDAPYKFSGKELDAETGYNYFGARYYDSGLSVWLSVDPLGDEFASYSPYNYVLGNPANYIDPDGETPILVTAAIGGIVNVGIGFISSSIAGREYSWGEAGKDFLVGALIGSGIGALATATGVGAASYSTKLIFGMTTGGMGGILANGSDQIWGMVNRERSSGAWDYSAMSSSALIGMVTGLGQSGLSSKHAEFFKRIAQKQFGDLSHRDWIRFRKIQTENFVQAYKSVNGVKPSKRQIHNEFDQFKTDYKNWQVNQVNKIHGRVEVSATGVITLSIDSPAEALKKTLDDE